MMKQKDHEASVQDGDPVLSGIIAFLVLSLVGLATAWVVATGYAHRPDTVALDRRIAIERRQDDVAWISLRDVARRHLAAVRTGAKDRPDEELDGALIRYSQEGKPFWRKTGQDPTPGLIVLKDAAYALTTPDRISCPEEERTEVRQRCSRYLEALVTVFGRDL